MSPHSSAITHIKWARVEGEGALPNAQTLQGIKHKAPQLRSSHSTLSNLQYSISIQGWWGEWLILVKGFEPCMAKGHTSYCGPVREATRGQ